MELGPYLCDAFGNATRIDYGTGHETAFAQWLCALCSWAWASELHVVLLQSRALPRTIAPVRGMLSCTLCPPGQAAPRGQNRLPYMNSVLRGGLN